MEYILPLKGAVKYALTLDPSVWIFDDRRIDLTTYFNTELEQLDEDTEYTKKIAQHWAREIIEGNTAPSTEKPKVKTEKQQMMTGTFGIYLKHFVKIAEPTENASTIVFETHAGEEFDFPLSDLERIILKYSEAGKALNEDGPVYVLLNDGSNLSQPIKNIAAIRIQ